MTVRKKYLLMPFFLSFWAGFCAEASNRPKPAFRTLFSDDLTNIVTCDSPYSPAGTPFTQQGLFGAVDETSGIGIDVHMLQPGYGWVPYWKSRIYSASEHAKWVKERYGLEPSSYTRYMLAGGDIVGDFVQRCRKGGISPFISLRMNDYHEKNYVDFTKEQTEEFILRDPVDPSVDGKEALRYSLIRRRLRDFFDLTVSRTYMDLSKYRLNEEFLAERKDLNAFEYADVYRNPMRKNNVLDWNVPAVRQHKLDFITEICENYDIFGLEMDFTRHPYLFRKNVPVAERLKIMTGYIREVRAVLDRTAENGQYRWLSVRIPFRISQQTQLGADVKTWHDAGVDIFNLSCNYVMQQQHDLAKIHQAAPEAPLYIELSHTPQRYEPVNQERLHKRDSKDLFMLTTPEEFYTTAHLAYSRGASGITAWNFVYYRAHDERRGGTVTEPPFEVFKILRDPELVAQQPQHYFLSDTDYTGRSFERDVKKNFNEIFSLDMAPPKGGWIVDGRLRIQVEPAWGEASCDVYFNDVKLSRTEDISEPYPTNLDEGLGGAESLKGWVLPKAIVKDGVNTVRVVIPSGLNGKLIFLDIGIR